MRHPILITLTLIVACSGGAATTVNPPPPPPGGTTPAVLAVQAGDGQQAEPGAALTIKPTVAVKDAAGLGVAGVTVTFSIDSGGGSLQATSATTGSDGTASPGNWQLGTSEGRNVISATAGSLTKVKLVATAVVSVGSVPATTLPSSGGSITVSQPGALHGFSLNIPSGSYPASTTWNITYRSGSTITKTAVMNPVSPVIHLSGTATGYSAKLLTITIPATIPANTFPVIMLRDPGSGLIEVLPTTDYDSVSVTAVTRHLNAAFFLKNNAARSAGLRGRSALRAGGYDVEVVVSTLTRAQLDADIDTGFRPGIDDWGFENPGTFFQPNGICGGMTLTAMWYFANKKADGNLSHRLDLALGVSVSNRGGIRWSSRVNAAQPDDAFGHAMEAATESAKRTPGVTAGQIRYDMIKAQLVVQQLPQLIVVGNSSLSHAVMAYRTVGTSIYITDPNVPGGLDQKVRFGSSEFVPYNMAATTGTGPVVLAYYVAGLGASALYDWGKFPDEYVEAVDGSIDEDVFPVTEMRSRFGVLSDTIYLADTMSTWVQCAACQSFPVPAFLTGSSGPLALMSLFRNPGGNLPWISKGDAIVNLWNPLSFSNPGDFRYGYAITGNDASGGVWVDWKTYVVRRLDASITPAAPADIVGNPISFAMQVTPNKLPSDVIYRWDFNDGSATVNVNNDNTVQHAFPRAGSVVVAAQILDARTQQPVAKANATVTIGPPKWRLDQFTITERTCPEPQCGTSFFTAFEQLEKIPSDGVIFAFLTVNTPAYPVFPTPGVFLSVAPGQGATLTQWAPFSTFTYSFGDTFVGQLGAGPIVANTFTWTGTVGTGAVSGQATPLSEGRYHFTIDATKSGPTIAGTMKMEFLWNGQTNTYRGTFRGQLIP